MTKAEAFATKHSLCAATGDVARVKRQLAKFYAAVELIDPPRCGYVQLYDGEAVRSAFTATMHSTMAIDAAIAMAEMPEHWPTRYRASVAYHLCPLLDEVVNS
jgi:hypothetical protein